MVQIRCINNGLTKQFAPGVNLQDVYDAFALDMPYGAVSARVNNKVEGLSFKIYNHKDVEFLDITSDSGMRTYVRSLFFVLTKAIGDLYPDGEIIIEHPISKGYFCSLRIGRPVTSADVDSIKLRMQEIIAADMHRHFVWLLLKPMLKGILKPVWPFIANLRISLKTHSMILNAASISNVKFCVSSMIVWNLSKPSWPGMSPVKNGILCARKSNNASWPVAPMKKKLHFGCA